MMNESKLKPCPFCGGEAIMGIACHVHEDYAFRVECRECKIVTPFYDTKAEAIEAWNKRAEPERKKGKWQRRKGGDCWECSECYAVLENSDIGNHNFYYCYHCGANMMDICGYMDLEKANYE